MRFARIFLACVFGLMTLAGLMSVPKSENLPIDILLTGTFCILCYVTWPKADGTQKKNAIAKLCIEADEFFKHVNASRRFPPSNAQRIIDKPSAPILAACDATLFELQQVRPSARIATRVNFGSIPIYIAPTPKSRQALQQTGSGELAVTPTTLIFSSPSKMVEIKLSKIVSIDIFSDGIQILSGGRSKPIMLNLSNGILWGHLLKNLIRLELTSPQLPDGENLTAG